MDKQISHYKIIEKLGEGGMGVVYKAQDTKLNRQVALKFLPLHLQAGGSARERFMQEARAASALDHPNVCTIHEISESNDGSLFISMAYYEGCSLQDRLKRGPVGFQEALDISIQIASGLECAHESGIVHRDIKPGNIMITNRGQVKIVDFGLAKLAGQSQLTQSGSTVGTAAYMSPEQISNGDVDHRSDIFSLGILMYEMFTGLHPFKSDYLHAIMYSLINEDPKAVRQIDESLPEELEWIINRAIEKDPGKRYQNIKDLVLHLEALKSGSLKLHHDQVQKLVSGEPQATDTGSGSGNTLLSSAAGADAAHPGTAIPRESADTAVSGPAVSRKPYLSVKSVLAGSSAVLLVAVLILLLTGENRRTVSQIFSPATMPEVKQIAVLPFMNIGSDPDNQAFLDGLVETLTSKLSQLEQFQGSYLVVPASETRASGVNSASAARESFGVNLAVTGSVQRLDRGVRVTINLIDAISLRQLGSKIIDDTFIEKSVLQDEAVFSLAGMLNIELQPEARQVLTAGGTSDPGAYEFYLQGRGHLQRFDRIDEITTAIGFFRRSLEKDPEFALASAALGVAHLYLFRRTEDVSWIEPAVEYTERALELDNRLSPVHTTLGLILIEKGEYERAHESLQRALELDPVNFEAYRGRARAFMAQQRTNEAESTYRRAIEMKPDYWAGYAELGVFMSRYGRFEEAADQFRNVIALTPSNASAWRNLGAVNFYLNKRQEAIESFNRSIEIQPDYSVLSNLGTLYFYDGNYNGAAEMYSRALALNDTDYQVWSYLATAYTYSTPGKPDEAADANRRALELAEERLALNPRDPGLLVSMAGYHNELGDPAKARDFLNRAIRLDPAETNILMGIGTVYEHLGNRDEALSWIGRAIGAGYSVEDIDRNPQLNLLREDTRYKDLVTKHAQEND
jgi:serine/threonine protein kinase/tetratricopeptide (TPR) repeat protein